MSEEGRNIIVEEVSVVDCEGDLYAYYTVRELDSQDGDIVTIDGAWIDYHDGLLVLVDGHIIGAVNDYLRENPIDEDLLESYRDASAAKWNSQHAVEI